PVRAYEDWRRFRHRRRLRQPGLQEQLAGDRPQSHNRCGAALDPDRVDEPPVQWLAELQPCGLRGRPAAHRAQHHPIVQPTDRRELREAAVGATFYPVYTTTTLGGQCVWQQGGAFIPGTKNTFGTPSEAPRRLSTVRCCS